MGSGFLVFFAVVFRNGLDSVGLLSLGLYTTGEKDENFWKSFG